MRLGSHAESSSISAGLRDIAQRLRNRPDTEHLQVPSRLLIAAIFLSYFNYVQARAVSPRPELENVILGIWITVGFIVGVFGAILVHPGASPTRRLLSMVVDVSITGYAMAAGGEVGIPAYIIYLFDVLGFGYRYGRKYMYLAMALCLASFGTVIVVSPYWGDRRAMGIVFLVAIVGTALFQASLIKVRENMVKEREKREELARSRNQLSKLAAHLQAAREEERTRIAREIHDELGNMLTVLRMDLANLPLADRKCLAEGVREISARVAHASSSLKKIVTQLRPSLLDTVGLVAAVGWLIRDFSERTGIPCEADIPTDELSAGRDLSTTVFRILQEALTNVARHSKADGVFIRLTEANDNIVLMVQDNGIGFSPDRVSPRESFGLMGIRERVDHCRGEMEVRSAPGEGAMLSIKLPITREARA